MINQHTWVDGMHFASEIPNYYTRYLATTKDKIAILVTFSAHKAHYAKYSNDFFKAIESLRVVATKSLMGAAGASASGVPGAGILGAGNTGGPGYGGEELPQEGSGSGKGDMTSKLILAAAIIVGAIGLFMVLGKKKSKPTKRK